MDFIRRMPKEQQLVLIAVLVLGFLALAWFADVTGNDDPDEDDDFRGYIIVSAVVIAIGAAILYTVVQRAETAPDADRPATVALVLGVLTFLGIAVFWSGLPFALGVPALHLAGVAGERAGPEGGRGKVTAATVLAVIGLLASAVFCVVG